MIKSKASPTLEPLFWTTVITFVVVNSTNFNVMDWQGINRVIKQTQIVYSAIFKFNIYLCAKHNVLKNHIYFTRK